MSSELQDRIQWFKEDYLHTPAGQKHLAVTEAEAQAVKKTFDEIREKYQAGQDITDDVLRRLLPHTDSAFHRNNGYRVSTWPCIQRDVRSWFEGAGWKKPEDWIPTASLIFEAVEDIVNGRREAWDKFLNSPYRHGFGTGFISPILFCLDDQFPVINSKVVKTYKYCTEQLGEPDEIDAKLVNYLGNAEKVKTLQRRLASLDLKNIREFDIFCHYMVSKRLGGGDFTKTTKPQYKAWLFVANPEIFRWEEAFIEHGVNWTGSKSAYTQKLLRQEQLHPGHRVFGYQAGPDYEISCELQVASDPYKTPEGTWAVDLSPVRRLANPISLSVLKNHPALSSLKFIQQTQMSISGITSEQLAALDDLVSEPDIQTEISTVDRLHQDLHLAQFDTANPSTYEQLLAEAFAKLGFETEHQGGPNNPDVLVMATLGSDSYTAVIEAKTCQKGKVVGLAQVNYASLKDHKEEHAADYALLVGPAFSGGKLVDHAVYNKVGMLTTDTLITILKQHDLFPFSLIELRRLFESYGLLSGLEAELERIHTQHYGYLQLTSAVLEVFDEFQRQREVSEPISSQAVYFLLLDRAQREQGLPPDRKQIDHVLALLSNPVLDILMQEEDGYILPIPPSAARQRLVTLESLIAEER